MSDPMDLLTPAQDGVVVALKTLIPVGLAAVYQHAPANTQPPYVMVADIDSESEGSKDEGQFERLTIEIHSYFRGPARSGLFAIMHHVRQLEGADVTTDDALFEPLRFLSASASRVLADGITYIGVSVFETIGQPAD